MRLGMRIVSEISASIILPLFVALFLGRYLDGLLGKHWVITTVFLAISAGITARIILVRARIYGKEYQQLITAEEKERQKPN